jgi:thioredoxin-like negative regulator of GroEL
MKPDWDQLAKEAHPSVFIADVNCGDQEELCQEQGVSGYPTIKIWKDGAMDDYGGGRRYEEMVEFVEDFLIEKCDVSKAEDSGCSEKAMKFHDKWKAKSATDLKKELERLEGMIEKPMAKDLKTWLRERLVVLRQL